MQLSFAGAGLAQQRPSCKHLHGCESLRNQPTSRGTAACRHLVHEQARWAQYHKQQQELVSRAAGAGQQSSRKQLAE